MVFSPPGPATSTGPGHFRLQSSVPGAVMTRQSTASMPLPVQPPKSPSNAPPSEHDNDLASSNRSLRTSDSNLPPNAATFPPNTTLPPVDTSAARLPVFHIRQASVITPSRSPVSAGLHIRTGASAMHTLPGDTHSSTTNDERAPLPTPSAPPTVPNTSTLPSSIKSSLSAMSIASTHSLSPGSALSSPALAAMTEITPLPSPILPGDSPGPWKRAAARPGSAGSLSSVREEEHEEKFSEGQTPARVPSAKRKKAYGRLVPQAAEAGGSDAPRHKIDAAHSRNRSMSEYVPEQMHNVRPRNVTIGSVQAAAAGSEATLDSELHREKYLAEQRGIASTARTTTVPLPTPPASNRSVTESEADELREEDPDVVYLSVRVGLNKRKRHYRPVRPLGQGTFSVVVLATDQPLPPKTVLNEASESTLDPKHLVAIKIVEHGPAGGADEERVELSLKREVELLRSISHPSLVHLRAFDFDEREALLVLDYCPGGDLFDLASSRRDVLTPSVVQRIFAELVGAVGYLHGKWIVHRDIKLENVLLNVHAATLPTIPDPRAYPFPLITLTDLGLSRQIPKPPASPLLHTRCGSEDYAAPEILLSQPYDGRATDAWALGVLLYALMEGRLPFDAPPARAGMKVARGRSKAAHRIARCEWMWCRFGDDDGEWDPARDAEWEGARDCVVGLLRKVSRGRYTIPELQGTAYVTDAILVAGGLKRKHDAEIEVDEQESANQSVDKMDSGGDVKMREIEPPTEADDADANTFESW